MGSGKQKPPPIDLGTLIESLSREGIEYIIVGGLAAVAQGAPVTTFDLDIVHRRTPGNICRLHALLRSIDAKLRRPDDKHLAPTAADLDAGGHLLLNTRLGPLDVLSCIEQKLGFEDLLPYSTEIDFHGYKVRVLNLEKMLELKRGSRDAKDQQRLPLYEETVRLMREKAESDDA